MSSIQSKLGPLSYGVALIFLGILIFYISSLIDRTQIPQFEAHDITSQTFISKEDCIKAARQAEKDHLAQSESIQTAFSSSKREILLISLPLTLLALISMAIGLTFISNRAQPIPTFKKSINRSALFGAAAASLWISFNYYFTDSYQKVFQVTIPIKSKAVNVNNTTYCKVQFK